MLIGLALPGHVGGTLSSSAAEGGASIHLEIDGGQYPGTYDLTTDIPCYVYGEGTWGVQVDDPAQSPSYLRLEAGGVADTLTVAWEAGGGYNAFELDLAVEESDGDATLSITALARTCSLPATTPIRSRSSSGWSATRSTTSRMPVTSTGPAPTAGTLPAAQVQGPPPDGSTVIDIDLDFGPWAGSYAAWTEEDACFVSEGTWMVTLHDPVAIPSSVSFVAAEAEGDEPGFGLLTASFGSLPDMTRYDTSADATIEFTADGHAAVSDPQAVASLPDGTQVEGTLEAVIECAGVSP